MSKDRLMIRSQAEWWKWSFERGTSGDMVIDILEDWKKERETLLSNLEKEKERGDRIEHDHEVALALRDAMRERVKELEVEKGNLHSHIDLSGIQIYRLTEKVKELEYLLKLASPDTMEKMLDKYDNLESHLKESEAKNQIYFQDVRHEQTLSSEINERLKKLVEAVEKHENETRAKFSSCVTEDDETLWDEVKSDLKDYTSPNVLVEQLTETIKGLERTLDFYKVDYANVEREMTAYLKRDFKSHATDAVIILLYAIRQLEVQLASIKADESIGKLVVECDCDHDGEFE